MGWRRVVTLKEFKFIVQPVFAVVDGDKVVGEQPADAVVLYGLAGLQQFMAAFPAELAQLNSEAEGALNASGSNGSKGKPRARSR